MSDLLERYAAELAASADYRVLRRLQPKTDYDPDDTIPTRVAICIDCETTGTDIENDEILEIGAVKFTYDATGRIHRIIDTFDQFRQPVRAEISDEISALTGITFDMVRGQAISATDIEQFIDGAAIILAHNAAFDAPRIQRLFPSFRAFCWGDSYTQINWKAEGFKSARLGDLLAEFGLFHDGHRASTDAAALVELLSRKLPVSNRTALSVLLDRARQPTILITVENAGRHANFLRSRGFRWHAEGDVKHWRLEASERQAKIECEMLCEDCPGIRISTRRVTAFTRFTEFA